MPGVDLLLDTEDGESLEAQLAVPDGATVGVVLAHPHPLYGGSMWDGPPAVLYERLPAAGAAAVRFNFRGVGRSTGTHDRGDAERLDVLAALAALPAELPVILCGYSFGADVCLTVDHPRVVGWCAIAPPLMRGMSVSDTPRPKLLLVPEHDQYDPPGRAAEETVGWAATTIEVIEGADHFLAGALGRVADAVSRFVLTEPYSLP